MDIFGRGLAIDKADSVGSCRIRVRIVKVETGLWLSGNEFEP
jgi:hypothetical protein